MASNESVQVLGKRDTPAYLPDSITRNFHPNELGTEYQAALAISVIAQARENYLGHDDASELDSCPYTAPSNPPPAPEYQPGTCGFHLKQWDDCNDEKKDLSCACGQFEI